MSTGLLLYIKARLWLLLLPVADSARNRVEGDGGENVPGRRKGS